MSTILFIEDDHTLTDKIDRLIREHLDHVRLLLHAENEQKAYSLCQDHHPQTGLPAGNNRTDRCRGPEQKAQPLGTPQSQQHNKKHHKGTAQMS